MVKTCFLSDSDIDFLLTQSEVISAKQSVDKLSTGSIYFTIKLTEILRTILFNKLGLEFLNIDSIPMRWIKGDIHSHVDSGSRHFDTTYLAYLTDSPGELIIDEISYPISKGNAYIFSEGVLHKTIGTGSEPRLLLGPMDETGISVGSLTIIANGETDTVYIKYIDDPLGIGTGIFYKINNDSYNWISVPIHIQNTNTDINFPLKILFETDIVFDNQLSYFICDSGNIQIGSTSLNTNGTRPIITIDSVTNYPGLIQNGTSSSNGFNNIYIFNLDVRAINGSTLVNYGSGLGAGGWIGQSYFGKSASNNFIVNCSSSGEIADSGGGIVGAYSGSETGASLYITGCSTSGNSGTYSGGIIGFNAGQNGGQVICDSCWSTGSIGITAGGIYGQYAGNNGGVVRAINCYSQGAIFNNGGGIYGQYAGNISRAEAINCYSQGIITTEAGGIFGSFAGNGGNTPAINCYSIANYTTFATGIYGSNAEDDSPINCYSANGNWSDSIANIRLTGTPNPIVGTIWVASGGANYPYELNNMGYTPYTIENIVFQGVGRTPILNKSYNQTILSGESSSPAIRPSHSYDNLKISGGYSSSYGTITVNDNTGVITTTTATLPGTYIITIRNTGSYNITLFALSVTQHVIPNVPICFLAGTPVLTDQGEIAIEQIDTTKNTIKGQKIVAITESIPDDSYLICIEKHSLGYNIPNRRTIISKDHKIMCDKKLVRAEYLIQYIPTIYKVPYNKQKLYNVLLNQHLTMSVNNLIVETMNPNNILAKVCSGNYTTKEKNELIKLLNKLTIQERKRSIISRNMYIS